MTGTISSSLVELAILSTTAATSLGYSVSMVHFSSCVVFLSSHDVSLEHEP